MSWPRKDSLRGKKTPRLIIGGHPGHYPSRAERAQQALVQGDIIITTERAAPRPGPAQTARRALAVSMGRAARSGIRWLGQGNGSAVPGAVALAIDPSALAGLAAQIPDGAVLVTGSNGKGTTCRMLAQVMQAAGLRPIANHEGSNQLAGVTTALLAGTGPGRRRAAGQPAGGPAIGLLEVDEGSCPVVFPQLARPGAVVVTNLFRDQLDRYLEPDYVRSLLEGALRSLPAHTTLVLNADDPRLAHLAPELPNPRLYFGVADTAQGRGGADQTSDSPRCPRCAGELSYSCVLYAHLGHWSCTDCGLARPAPDVEVSKIDLLGPGSSRLQLTTPDTEIVVDVPLPGLYNAYNALAAAAAATAGHLPASAVTAIERVTAGCLRMERIAVPGHDVYLALAKNANGYTEVLRSLAGDGQPRWLLLGLNDCAGKQPDLSWIWDVDFDALRGRVPVAAATGSRASDLAVRLKYAGWLSGAAPTELATEPDPVPALRHLLARVPVGQPVWVISTSIVLSQLRSWLHRLGYAGELWEDAEGAGGWQS
jgi:lipid II isoglutaminyl synthase (glutamine-hydrolysing)